MFKSKWTDEMVGYLLENYDKKTMSELIKYLGRSKTTINRKLKSLGINKDKRKHWTKEEISFIKNNYSKMTVSELAVKFSCNIGQISHLLKNINTEKKKNYWSDEEVEFMFSNIEKGYEFISDKLGRSLKSVKSKYQKYGKVYHKKEKSIINPTDEDIELIKQGNRSKDELIKLLPHLTENQIVYICRNNNVKLLPNYLKSVNGEMHRICKKCNKFKKDDCSIFRKGSQGLICRTCEREINKSKNWNKEYGIEFKDDKSFYDYSIIEWYELKLIKNFRSFPRHMVTEENNEILLKYIVFDKMRIKNKEEFLKLDMNILAENTLMPSMRTKFNTPYKENILKVFKDLEIKPEELNICVTIDGLICNSKAERDLYNYIYKNYKTDISPIGTSRKNKFYNEKENESYYPDFKITKINNKNVKPIIIEYYGLHSEKDNYFWFGYQEKTKRKNEFYSKLDNYIFLDLYPKDLKYNFKGVKDKLDNTLKEVMCIEK